MGFELVFIVELHEYSIIGAPLRRVGITNRRTPAIQTFASSLPGTFYFVLKMGRIGSLTAELLSPSLFHKDH